MDEKATPMPWLMDQALALSALRQACSADEADEETTEILAEECEFKDAVSWAVRKMRDAEGMADAISNEIAALVARRKRYADRGERIKGGLLAAMELAGARKLELPQATVTVRSGPVSVHVTDVDALPVIMRREKTVIEPDKHALRAALEAGEEIPGAMLSNGMPVLTVKVA
jgi:hypothetical protein